MRITFKTQPCKEADLASHYRWTIQRSKGSVAKDGTRMRAFIVGHYIIIIIKVYTHDAAYAACDTRNAIRGMHHHMHTQHAIRDERYVTFRATIVYKPISSSNSLLVSKNEVHVILDVIV